MSLRSIFKGAMLVTASAALIAVITIAGILALAFYYSDGGRSWSVSITRVSDALTYDGAEYDFSGDELLGDDRWAILIGEDGRVIWSLRIPSDVPDRYTLTDVASFTRWYLGDYPVQCRIRDDGLLVVGSPRGSVWKHDISMQSRLLHDAPLWIGGIFLLALGCVLLLAYFAVRRWFRQAQRVRDAARSDWTTGSTACPTTSAPRSPWSWATPPSWRGLRIYRRSAESRRGSSASRARRSGTW